jgi:trimeric autotransporter adhesin
MEDNNIEYYDTNCLLIDTPNGFEYGGVSAWQGIRRVCKDTYVICGTTNPNPNNGYGLVYVGNISCTKGKIYYLNVIDSIGTSVYGPNYNNVTKKFTFVGSYTNNDQEIKGFLYNGELNNLDLSNKLNFKFPSVNFDYKTVYCHSFSGGLFVGNCSKGTNLTDTISFIYDINNVDEIKAIISYPGSLTTTSYGIWHNGSSSYTIVGGYSTKAIPFDNIYNNKYILPYESAFIVDYDSLTNKFYNWTEFRYQTNNKQKLVTHFEGISRDDDGIYSLNADVVDLSKSLLPIGYYLKIERNKNGKFITDYNKWVELHYKTKGSTSSNSVCDNKIVGLYVSKNENVSYQAEIN